LVACLAGSALLAEPVSAQADRAEGALFLLLPVGAQAVSLGRAMTWVEGAEGGFWNPSGLAGVERSQVVIFRGDHVAGTATAVTALWARRGVGALGASYFLLDAGQIDQTDEFGNYTGTITIRNHLGIVSGATRIGSRLSAGVNLKLIRFQLACRGICADEGTMATTYAIDVGIQGTPTDALRLGAMVAHLGPSLQVLNAEQADPLPARLRVAAAYNVMAGFTETDDLRGWVAVEVEDRLRNFGSPSLYLGSELTAGGSEALSLRAGWVFSDLNQEDGGRVGLGILYERFDLSIAKSLTVSSLTGETEPVYVTFSIGF
jgi:hypothetical protein